MVILKSAKKRIVNELIFLSGGNNVHNVTRQHIIQAIENEKHVSIRTVYNWLEPFRLRDDGKSDFINDDSLPHQHLKREREQAIPTEHMDILLEQLMLTPNLKISQQADFCMKLLV